MCQLTAAEWAESDQAKAAEISNWLSTGTESRILRHKFHQNKSYDVVGLYMARKESKEDQMKTGKSRRAKARLVVLVYLDPVLEQVPRDSPTLGRQSRMLILQLISAMNRILMSFACLQGSTQGRVIGLEPPPEMAAALQLLPQEVCKLDKSAYGLMNAPFLWHQELDKALQELSFIPSPFDPTVYLLYEPDKDKPAGIIGVHFDDGLCGGNQYSWNSYANGKNDTHLVPRKIKALFSLVLK